MDTTRVISSRPGSRACTTQQVRRVDEDSVAVRGIAEANALHPGVDDLDARVRRIDVVLAEHIVKIDHVDACDGHHLVAPDLAVFELIDAAARRVVNGDLGLRKEFGASRRRPSKILLTAPLQRYRDVVDDQIWARRAQDWHAHRSVTGQALDDRDDVRHDRRVLDHLLLPHSVRNRHGQFAEARRDLVARVWVEERVRSGTEDDLREAAHHAVHD
eukprot:4883869-Prymnesium_polylepis.1